MDVKNIYHTKQTYLLVRLEHVAIVVVCSLWALINIEEINWGRFITAFLIIDLVGYLPGAIAYRRQSGGHIAPLFHYLYNFTHSYLTVFVAIAIWATVLGGFEFAMLAFPIHLSGDRGLFGNFYKPVALYFEPTETSATAEVNAK